MKTILTDPAAETELAEAADRYERKQAGLSVRFLDAVAEAVSTIQRLPKAFPHFKMTATRKYVMEKFPYVIFYEEDDADIFIYAFAHTKREPGYWMKRTDGKETPEELSE